MATRRSVEEAAARNKAQWRVIDEKLDSATDKLVEAIPRAHLVDYHRQQVRDALKLVVDAAMLAVDLRLSRDERI